MKKTLPLVLGAAALSVAGQGAHAACGDVARADLLQAAIAVKNAASSGGFNLNMWVTMVDETGKVCYVVTTANGGAGGATSGNSAWLGSRVISVQKANTANAFGLDGFSISTANLYGLVQPGGSLFGLQESNPVNSSIAYVGMPANYGTANDPLINQRPGGVNVFGGGLALYKTGGSGSVKVGAIGVSGDSSCADHEFAWQVRQTLGLDKVPAGFWSGTVGGQPTKGDEMNIVSSYANAINTPSQVGCFNSGSTDLAHGVLVDGVLDPTPP